MNRINRGIQAAADAARLTTHSRYLVGAAIYKGSRLISIGWAQDKTHPKVHSIFRWQHAEMSALVGTKKVDLSSATIYVARIIKSGEYRIAKPCEDCERILRAAGLKNVVYTDRNGQIQKMRLT